MGLDKKGAHYRRCPLKPRGVNRETKKKTKNKDMGPE